MMRAVGNVQGGMNDETPPGLAPRGLAPFGGPLIPAASKLAPRAGLECDDQPIDL